MDHRHFGYKAKLDPVCLRCAFPVVSVFVAEIASRATDRQTDRWSSPSSRKDRGRMCLSNERWWKRQAHNMHWCCWTGEQLNRGTIIDNLFERRAYVFFLAFLPFFFPPPFAASETMQQCDYDTMIPMMERILGKRISGTRHPNLCAHCKLITIRE